MESNYLTDIFLIDIFPIVDNILKHLPIASKIVLASMDDAMQKTIFSHCPNIRGIAERSCLNLDLIPHTISVEDLEIVNKVFPNIEKLKLDLKLATKDILSHMNMFLKLKKLSLYTRDAEEYASPNKINIKRLTLRQLYGISDVDTVLTTLRQVKNVKRFSLYQGKVSIETLDILISFKLESLKIHNSDIKGLAPHVMSGILENENLKILKLTSEKYFKFPGPIKLTELLLGFCPFYSSKIERFIFALDFKPAVKYENLKYMTSLTSVQIHFSAISFTQNVEKIVKVALDMKDTRFEFVEFLEIPMCPAPYYMENMAIYSRKFVQSLNQLKLTHNVPNVSIRPLYYEEYLSMK